MSGNRLRSPRIRLGLNGSLVDGCLEAEIISSRGCQASTFRVVASSRGITNKLGPTWIDSNIIEVTIDLGLNQDETGNTSVQWIRMISGSVDRINLDQISGRVSLDGRDYAARLMSATLQTNFMNKTSSEVAAALASLYDLSANVNDSAGLIGRYYQIEHSKGSFAAFSRHGNAWDLLTELAELEGYDLWVDGTTLNFCLPDYSDRNIFEIDYSLSSTSGGFPSLTVDNIQLERLPSLSSPVQVKVVSWNSRQRFQVESLYPQANETQDPQFIILKPNLLPDQAQKLARMSYDNLRTHQRTISGTMAGELQLTPRHRIRLSGTGTGWDGLYTLDRIEREISLDRGFRQHFIARLDPYAGGDSG